MKISEIFGKKPDTVILDESEEDKTCSKNTLIKPPPPVNPSGGGSGGSYTITAQQGQAFTLASDSSPNSFKVSLSHERFNVLVAKETVLDNLISKGHQKNDSEIQESMFEAFEISKDPIYLLQYITFLETKLLGLDIEEKLFKISNEK